MLPKLQLNVSFTKRIPAPLWLPRWNLKCTGAQKPGVQ